MNNLLEKVASNTTNFSGNTNTNSYSTTTTTNNRQQGRQQSSQTNFNNNNNTNQTSHNIFTSGNTNFTTNFTTNSSNNSSQATINFGGNTFCLNNPNDINSFINNLLGQDGISNIFANMGYNNMTMNQNQSNGQNIYTNVYSNVNGNSNNINFNEEFINQNSNTQQTYSNEDAEYMRQVKELKNYKYRQLVRGKYSDYMKAKRQHSNRTVSE
jgi:hypothetical protein